MRVREEEGHCHACMRCGIYPIAGVRVFLAGARASLRTPQLRFSVVLLLLASFFFFFLFSPLFSSMKLQVTLFWRFCKPSERKHARVRCGSAASAFL